MIVERPASVYDGFPQMAPLVYHYGQVNLLGNPVLYNTIVSQMAELVHQRMESNKKGRMMNTTSCGWMREFSASFTFSAVTTLISFRFSFSPP